MKRQMQQMEGQMKQSPWFISQEQREKYQKIFAFFDKGSKGYLDDEELQGAFKQTGLGREALGHAWELANPEGEDFFNLNMFSVAMHLLFQHRHGHPLPQTIPQELVYSISLFP